MRVEGWEPKGVGVYRFTAFTIPHSKFYCLRALTVTPEKLELKAKG